jgi:hypothetical protein
VYEAIAFNTLPIRKNGILYKGAVAERGLLLEMAERLNAESLPVQIMHNDAVLPVGRVFYGNVLNTGSGAELRVLFFVSQTHEDLIRNLDNGTVDQVSVSVLPKQVLCSECGFDYLSDEAGFDNIYEGVCDKGHKLGENGVHTRLVGLSNFFEMSLVGRGGAQNARIVPPNKAVLGSTHKLAASGLDPSRFVLAATVGTNLMTMEELVAQLTDSKAQLKVKTDEFTALQASLTAKEQEISQLQAQLAEAGKDKVEALKAELDAAMVLLKDIATKVLVAAGDVDPKLPEKVAELKELITSKADKMTKLLTAGSKAIEAASDDVNASKPKSVSLGAFRVNRD